MGSNTNLGLLSANIEVNSAAVVGVVVSEVLENRLLGGFKTKFVDVYFYPEMDADPTEEEEEAMSFRVLYTDKDDKKKIRKQFEKAIKAVEEYIGVFYENPKADVMVEFSFKQKNEMLKNIINTIENTFEAQEA